MAKKPETATSIITDIHAFILQKTIEGKIQKEETNVLFGMLNKVQQKIADAKEAMHGM